MKIGVASGGLQLPRTRLAAEGCSRNTTSLCSRPVSGNLKAGDVGTVVHVHPGRDAYVVEFTTLDGSTVVVATVPANQARPVTSKDIPNARKVGMTA